LELIVVDQSQPDQTRPPLNDPRLRVIRDSQIGSSRARNLGLAASRAEIIAFTDDDCTADENWLAEIVAGFQAHPHAGVACGVVSPAPHDVTRGFIVGYEFSRAECLSGPMAKLHDAGIGANMAIRRSVLGSVGGWDELLGAGSTFNGAGDLDLVYRVLLSGYDLLHLPKARVDHFGFRDWSEGRNVIRGRYRGVGAAYAKHLRQGDPVAALLLARELGMALANVADQVVSLRRPFGFGRVWSLLRGMRESLAYPVDPRTRLYMRRCRSDLHGNRTQRRVHY
jgi:GT2 family glycosyltransferase